LRLALGEDYNEFFLQHIVRGIKDLIDERKVDGSILYLMKNKPEDIPTF
jgi:hypothetical protein